MIAERNGVGVSYHWFRTKEKAEALIWRDYIRLKFSSSIKKIQPFPVFLEKLQIRIDENQDSNRMLEI